jgi:hypothetical protein
MINQKIKESDVLEKDVKKEIYDFCEKSNLYYLRVNSGKIRKGASYVFLAREGTPELWINVNSKFIPFEIKRDEKEKQQWLKAVNKWIKTGFSPPSYARSISQYKEAQRIKRLTGQETHLVCSLDEVIEVLKQYI